jgi:hypothetical protein
MAMARIASSPGMSFAKESDSKESEESLAASGLSATSAFRSVTEAARVGAHD